jgi:glycosyltransferase involved in cell wall biosynthesis
MIIGGIPGSIINFRRDLIIEWLKLGYSVTAVTAPADTDSLAKISEMSVKFRSIPLEREGLNPVKDLRTLVKLFNVIKDEMPDIIFTYTVKPNIFCGLCMYLLKDIKLFSMITGLGYAFSGSSIKQKAIKWFLKLLYKLALRKNEVIFFQNHEDRDLFVAQNLVSTRNRLIVVNGSGVNTEHYFYSAPKCTEKISFLMMARLIKSKGVIVYADAAARIKEKYPNTEFALLGSYSVGPDSIDPKRIEEWQAEGIISFKGRRDDVRPFILDCSVYVLPSAYREGVPRSTLEAMSMGRPVITTDSTGCRETVIDGVNGFLISVNDVEDLAEKMERFIKEPRLVETMGRKSRELVESKFDVHKVNGVIIDAMLKS